MIGNIDIYVRAHVQQLRTGLMTASRDVDTFGRSLLGLNRNLRNMNSRVLWESQAVARSALVMGAAVVAGMGLAVKSTAEFEERMRNVNSIAQMGERRFEQTGAAVLAMTRNLPQTANQLAEGLYDIVSSGFDGAEALSVLEASATAASAGLTDTQTAARAIAGVLNAYGPAVGNAAYVSDVLFKVVDVGVVTFEELAQNMGQFIGIASQGGVAIEEVGAAYATITRAGIPAAQASTALMRVIQEFIKPSENLSAIVTKLGYETPYLMLQQLGLAGAFEKVSEAVGGTAPGLASVFQDIRGLRGALALAAQDGKLFNNVVEEFNEAGGVAGATARALAEQQKSLNYQLKILRNAVVEAAHGLGTEMLPAAKGTTTVLTTMTRGFMDLPGPVKFAAIALTFATTALIALAAATIMIAPRMAAARIAVTELAVAMPRLATATNLATASIGKLLAVASAATILATVAMNVENIANWSNRVQFGAPNISKLSAALIDLGKAGTSAELARAMAMINELGRFGQKSFKTEAMDIGAWLAGPQTAEMWGIDKQTRQREGLKASVRDLDDSLAALVNMGHADLAAEALKRLAQSESFVGISTKELVDEYLPDYNGAIAGVTLQAKAAGNEVDKFGVQIDDSGDAAQQAADELKAYEDSLADLQGILDSFISGEQAISAIQAAHQRASEDAEDQAKAEHDIADALDRHADAADRLEAAQEKIDRIMYVTNGGPLEGTEAARDLRKAQRDANKARRDMAKSTDEQQTAEEKYQRTLKDGRVTLAEYREELRRQVDAQNAWRENINKIAAMPGVNEAVLQHLINLGPDNAGIVEQLARAGPEEMQRTIAMMSEATAHTGLSFAKEVDLEMKVAQIKGREGAALTTREVLDELRKIAPGITAMIPDVERAMGAVGLAMRRGVMTGMDVLNQMGTQIDNVLNGIYEAERLAAEKNATFPVYGPVYVNPNPAYTDTSPNVAPIPVTPAPTMYTDPTQLPSQPATTGGGGGTVTVLQHNYNIETVVAQDVNEMEAQLERKARIGQLAGGAGYFA